MPEKNYRIQYNVGTVRYAVSYHDGVKTHSDGSPFYDTHCLSNKREMEKFCRELEADGYAPR